ncbi:MAG: VWA domain-containing protein [Spirochaetes bacterium]|nr:VWA domain-containing protein [Spirochaetota bacterium]
MRAWIILFLFLPLFLNFQPYIDEEDIYFEKADTGYELYIRQKNGVKSILLTESQKDPQKKKTNYGLRTRQYFPPNGDEIRILDNRILHTKYEAFFLVDSTLENHPTLGKAFHFYLPEEVIFGYDWTRNGVIHIHPGIKVNLRLFSKKYSDYTGQFLDQWITLKFSYSENNFRPNLINDFNDLSNQVIIKSENDSLEDIFLSITDYTDPGELAEIIFIIDVTDSMKEEMPVFKKIFPQLISELKNKIDRLKIGFILYRDYGENFIARRLEMSENIPEVKNLVNRLGILGGMDIPEAVNEAIFQLQDYNFETQNPLAVLFGDAPAHPKPRGEITRQKALQVVDQQNIKLIAICLPFQ